jgi:hypothetical protein
MNHSIPTGLATWVARLVLLLSLGAGLATAQTKSDNYTFLLGSGFLCDGNDASTCPATAKAIQGDSYQLSGAGTFEVQGKSVKGAGTYTHKSTTGHLLDTGVWTASELVSFASYGIAPGVLKKGVGPQQQLGPKRPPSALGPVPTGGLAVFRILLLPMSGGTKTAVLQVNCAFGQVPSERSVEGIRLTLERNNFEYSEESGGRMMFLLMRSEASESSGTTLQQNSGETPGSPHE